MDEIYFLIRPYSISLYNLPPNCSVEMNCKNAEKRTCLHVSVIPIMSSIVGLKKIVCVQSVFVSCLDLLSHQ